MGKMQAFTFAASGEHSHNDPQHYLIVTNKEFLLPVNRPAPTLHDVAREAGVSTATVSRCLNMPDRVIDSTRVKVMAAIEKLGYSPNFGARVMAARRTNTIGAIIPTMENAIFARGLQAFQEELRIHGYTLLVASSSYRPDIEEEQVRTLVARGAEGLLLIGYDRDPRVYQFLHAQNIPFLIAWAYDASTDVPAVGFDNQKSMRNLATEVIAKGHKRIGVISAETKTNDRARLRVDGIREATRAAGLDASSIPVVETHYGIEAGAAALEMLLTRAPDLTAVMCGNDVLAAGAIKKAREIGLDVPRDLSITGFDDIELANVVSPALTTVHVPHRDMGRKAATTLIGMMGSPHEGENIELEAKICLRQSLAPMRRTD